MIQPRTAHIFFHPEQADVTGEILTLTEQMATERIHKSWWNNKDLKERFDAPPPIDQYWHWTDIGIEFESVEYTPMELPARAAEQLLNLWDSD